jgi:hypothetical protein
MLRNRLIAAGMAAATLGGGVAGVAAQGADASSAHPAAAGTIVLKLRSVKVALGSTNKAHAVLVSSSGGAVYLLTGDSKTHPQCTVSACKAAWPALTTTSTKPMLGKGVTGTLAIWHHGHVNQLTLNGHPLYTPAADSNGAALGQGIKHFGGTWKLLSASGQGENFTSGSGSGSGSGSTGY